MSLGEALYPHSLVLYQPRKHPYMAEKIVDWYV